MNKLNIAFLELHHQFFFKLFLLSRLTQNVSKRVDKTPGLLPKFQNRVPRISLITVYKSIVQPYLDDGDVIYNKGNNFAFHQKLESFYFFGQHYTDWLYSIIQDYIGQYYTNHRCHKENFQRDNIEILLLYYDLL